MHVSYILSFVEVFLIFFDFDHSRGRSLRCCSRHLLLLADPVENLRALDTYTTYLVDCFLEALRARELEQTLSRIFHPTVGDSEDY